MGYGVARKLALRYAFAHSPKGAEGDRAHT